MLITRPARFYCAVAIAAFITIAMGCHGSWAQSVEQKFHLDFDTFDGHFSSWKLDDVGSVKSLRATIKVTRLGTHERWTPVLRIEVTSKSTTDEYWGLLVTADQHVAPLTAYSVQRSNKNTAQRDPFAKKINTNEAVAVELSWATAGKLLIRIGGEARELPMPAPVAGILVLSGTGDFHLDNVTLSTK